jgi:hypothetical protein
MFNYWFTWANMTSHSLIWQFLDGGNYFETAAMSKRVEQNQYDIGDSIRILIANQPLTLTLTGAGWAHDLNPNLNFSMVENKMTCSVQLTVSDPPR